MFLFSQDHAAVMDVLRGETARAAGITYLQNERYTFQGHPDGKTWSVYGSPVRSSLHNSANKLMTTAM